MKPSFNIIPKKGPTKIKNYLNSSALENFPLSFLTRKVFSNPTLNIPLHRIITIAENTIELPNGLQVLTPIIRINSNTPDSSKKSKFFIEIKHIQHLLQSKPTLKLIFPTNIETKEYLPILFDPMMIEPPGTTWVPLTSKTTSRIKFSALAITNPFTITTHLELLFTLDQTIHPAQLDIRDVNNNLYTPRKRRWNISTGRSTLYEPIIEPTDFPVVYDEPIITPSQAILIHVEDILQLPSPLEIFNIYLRRSLNQVNFFYVKCLEPVPGGIMVCHKKQKIFFSRLYSVKNRSIYRRICKQQDWINIFPPSPEFHLLFRPMLTPIKHV
jgi:hypothetical protein